MAIKTFIALLHCFALVVLSVVFLFVGARLELGTWGTEALQMVIPSHASEKEIAEFRLLHEAAKDNLKYIGDIWLTVNQVTKNHNLAEFKLWGEYEDRNINALDHGIKRLSTLINEPTV